MPQRKCGLFQPVPSSITRVSTLSRRRTAGDWQVTGAADNSVHHGALCTFGVAPCARQSINVLISLVFDVCRASAIMFTARKKILKEKNADPDVFEESVAQVIGEAVAACPSDATTGFKHQTVSRCDSMHKVMCSFACAVPCHAMRQMPAS